MCNAFNHSYSCACGWGGFGHGGRSTDNYQNNALLPQFKVYSQILRSCTIPNANCPVCKSKVFFYSSPYGGRVFFDALGPPWPKHPCTDNGRAVVIRNISEIDNFPVKTFSGTKGDWQPFLCLSVTKVGFKKDIFEITGDLNGITKTFFTRVTGLSDKYPYFVKENDGEARLSTFMECGKTLENFEFIVNVYLSEIQGGLAGTPREPRKVIKIRSNKKSQQKIKKITKALPKKNNFPKKENNVKPIRGKFQEQLSSLKGLIPKL